MHADQHGLPSQASALPSPLTAFVGRDVYYLDLYEAAQHMKLFLAHDQSCPAPEPVLSFLELMRIRICEELAWQNGSMLYAIMHKGGGGSCDKGEVVR